ncbi:MAG: nuclear transport factor 2 family protein [Bacteroidetes bacterium]|nr:nuclear transport factor 2 family protein [Bacteroidota bacterium]MBU1718600.1 nuclear transport factor 2 family protein [Bacteroidota bacterium]
MYRTTFFQRSGKLILCAILSVFFLACNPAKNDKIVDTEQISAMLDSFNQSAASADFDAYFSFFADDAVFLGTDATEYWDKKSFMEYARPHFEKGKTWNFKALERHIYSNEEGNIAWFDELLDTQMKICRGSGVLIKMETTWKIQQYVLSMTVPNNLTDTVIKLKSEIENAIIEGLNSK